jgi:membrane protein
VPALAIILGMMAAFPAFDHLRIALQDAIVTNLVPDTGLKLNDALAAFVAAAGKLTLFGVVGLIFSAALLLLTIEGALNEIFRVIQPRTLRHRLLVFWAVMTIGPVLLGLGLSLLGYFAAPQIMERHAGPLPDSIVILLGNLTPSLLTWATLTFLFSIIPNRKLNRRDALIGGGIAALLLATLRYTFAFGITAMTSYQAIYGAIAAVPVFLVWTYLVWLAVLIGAVITAALPDWRYARVGFGMSVTARMALALEVLSCLIAARRGGTGMTVEQMAKLIGAPDNVLTAVVKDLRTGLFVAPTDEGRWILSRDLDRTPLADLVHHFGLGLNTGMGADDLKLGELGKRLNQHLVQAAQSERMLLSVTLARLLEVEEKAASQ